MRSALLLLGTALLAAPAFSQTSTSPGYSQSPAVYPGSASLVALPSGALVSFDGQTVDLYDSSGELLENLFSFPEPVFTGALGVSPSGQTLLFGESSTGVLRRVDLATGAVAELAVVTNNTAVAFESETQAILSAATCGFGCGNDLLRLDMSTGAVTPLASLDGASGPVAFGPDGALYYALVSGVFPAPAGSTSVLRFEPDQLSGSPVVTEAEASVLAGGFDGASGLAVDPEFGTVFLAEASFGTGVNRLHRLTAEGDSRVIAEGVPFNWITGLQFLPGSGDGFFFPFQPASNGELAYVRTDFYTYEERLSVVPERATLNLDGPGLLGAGAVNATVSGGPETGFWLLAGGFTALAAPFESPFFVDGKPLLHTSLNLASIRVANEAVDFDGAKSSFVFVNVVGAVGLLTLQGVLFDTDGSYLGTTTSAAF